MVTTWLSVQSAHPIQQGGSANMHTVPELPVGILALSLQSLDTNSLYLYLMCQYREEPEHTCWGYLDVLDNRISTLLHYQDAGTATHAISHLPVIYIPGGALGTLKARNWMTKCVPGEAVETVLPFTAIYDATILFQSKAKMTN
ncbi:hypothetical protein DACRYDRAFT_14935 [Dacryopinax primogenitus]|uniref:Uncharacterized protein n=1 Tax=Dacryopinax primogenitus (strain DJM 731) TaxID=1858805 RepID=M5G437_DACPD|nr:uncharacterized protein DACRYDRAFT_14935 [Dacryopinax primogenitus]EJU02975.1 hypothetical protein DACRYDRAFT_14935 [Dacryopinax primogenitus]